MKKIIKNAIITFFVTIRITIDLLLFLFIIFTVYTLYNQIYTLKTFKLFFNELLPLTILVGIYFLYQFYKTGILKIIFNNFKDILGGFIYKIFYIKQLYSYEGIQLKKPFLLLFNFKHKSYFKISNFDKKLLKEKDNKKLIIRDKVESFFRKKLPGVNVIEITTTNNIIITLYRPDNLEENKVKNLNGRDTLFGMNFSPEKYNIEIKVSGIIKMIISEKIDKKVYKIQDYIDKFSKNKIYLGYDSTGEAIEYPVNLTEANHFGVYGTTGGGKTNFTTSVLYTLYLKNKNFNFYVIDFKGDLADFENLNRINYANSINDILKICRKIRSEMDSINKEFKRLKVRNYKEYLEKIQNKDNLIKPTYIFFEEFSMLLSKIDDKDSKNEVIKTVKEISIAGRSIAYNLVLSLQIPLVKIINDSEITRMLKVISLRIDNSLNNNIFGSKVDYDLNNLNVGEGIFKNGGDVIKFKSFLVEKHLLNDLKKFRKNSTTTLSEEYLNHAKNINSFSKADGINFGLSRTEFDELSVRVQKLGIIEKASNNVLTFSKKNLQK